MPEAYIYVVNWEILVEFEVHTIEGLNLVSITDRDGWKLFSQSISLVSIQPHGGFGYLIIYSGNSFPKIYKQLGKPCSLTHNLYIDCMTVLPPSSEKSREFNSQLVHFGLHRSVTPGIKESYELIVIIPFQDTNNGWRIDMEITHYPYNEWIIVISIFWWVHVVEHPAKWSWLLDILCYELNNFIKQCYNNNTLLLIIFK